jgi:PsbP-like protein/PsbP
MMFRIILIVLFPLLAFFICAFSSQYIIFAQTTESLTPKTTTTNGLLTYENTTYGIRIQYPADWIYREHNSTNIVLFAPPGLISNSSDSLVFVTVGIEKLPFHNIPLNAYSNLTINSLNQTQPDFQVIESVGIVLAGHPANQIVYTVGEQNTMLVFTIRDDEAVIIAYHAESPEEYLRYLAIVEKMISSFIITDTNVADIATSYNNGTKGFLVYSNSTYGLRLQYPNTWAVYDSFNNTNTPLIVVADIFPSGLDNNADVFISLDKTFEYTGINQGTYVNGLVSDLQTTLGRNFTLTSVATNSTTLADQPAYTLNYTVGSVEGETTRVMEVGAVIGNIVYMVDYQSTPDKYATFLPQVRNLIDSFEVLSSSNK